MIRLAGLLVGLLTHAAFAEPLSVPVQRAPQPSAFVPAGWVLEQRVNGDLNGDGRKDAVLVLVQSPETEGDRERALVVALRMREGYEVAGTNSGMLAFVGGLGVRGGSAAPEVKVRRGVLSVAQYGGSRDWYDVVHRFKWSAHRKALELVGLTNRTGDRLVGSFSERTCDLVGGTCVVRSVEKAGAKQKVVRQKPPRAPSLTRLEDVTRDE